MAFVPVQVNWQSQLKSPIDRFSYVAKTGRFSDLTMSSFSGKLFHVHQIVLSMHSKVFDRMFYGSIEFDSTTECQLDVSDEILEWLVNYMYKNEALMHSVENAMELYRFAHQWQMDQLLARCSKYLETRIDKTNAREILEFTFLYADNPLTECCLAFLGKQQNKHILNHISDYSREALTKIISYGGNWCSESQIFKSIYTWAEQRLNERNQDVTGATLRQELGDLVFKVRYLLMTPKEFVTNVLSTDILTDEENLSILLRLTNIDSPWPKCIREDYTRKGHFESNFIHCVIPFKKNCSNNNIPFTHWNIHHSEQLMMLNCSENIIVRCVRMRSECFPGKWSVVIKTIKGTPVTVSNESGPPWFFTNAVLLSGSKYLVNVFGRGGKYNHPMTSFDADINGTFFSGQSCQCGVVIEFCLC